MLSHNLLTILYKVMFSLKVLSAYKAEGTKRKVPSPETEGMLLMYPLLQVDYPILF
jgi:hypothetical protein